MEIGEQIRELDELKDVAEKQELRVRYLETRTYQLALAYLCSMSFLFNNSGTSNSSLNYCSRWWMLSGFNLFCSVLYILFFLESVTMMSRAHNHLDIIFQTLDQISQQLINILKNLPTNRPDPDHDLEGGDSVSSTVGFGFSSRVHELEYRPYTILHWKPYFTSILCAFLALTAVQLSIAFNHTPCNA